MIYIRFTLKDKVLLISGGGDFLPEEFASEIINYQGLPILIGINESKLKKNSQFFKKKYSKYIPNFCYDFIIDDKSIDYDEN